MWKPLDYVLLDLIIGLGDAVNPSLRAVTVDIDEKNEILFFFFFYDGLITSELFEFATVAIAEAGVTLSDFTAEAQIIRLDFPEEIPLRGKVAYYRYEPCLPFFEKENRAHLLREPGVKSVAVLALDMQGALLGKVMPNLRLVSVKVEADQKLLKFYFVFDGEISENNARMAEKASQEASSSFSGFKIEKWIERTDYPGNITNGDFFNVYLRYENTEAHNCSTYFKVLGTKPTVLTHPNPELLVQEYAGTGFKYSGGIPGTSGYIEDVDFNEVIGYTIALTTGIKTLTRWGKIHYSKGGVHIIPTNPRTF